MGRALGRVVRLLVVSWMLTSWACLPLRAAQPGSYGALELAVEEGRVDFGEVSPAMSPHLLQNAVYIAVKTWGTGPWNLTVQATGDFSADDGGRTFPIGNLEVAARLNGDPAPFRACSTQPVALVSNGPAGGGIVVMDYRLNVGYDVAPLAPGASYGSELVYSTSYGFISASFVDPDPFNPYAGDEVKVRYWCPADCPSPLSFWIHDSAGSVVCSRFFASPGEGWHEQAWNGRRPGGSVVPDGVYSYYITASIHTLAAGYIRVQTAPRAWAVRDDEAPSPPAGIHISISARAEPGRVSPGDILTYRADVRNAGAFPVGDVQVSFGLPDGIRQAPGTTRIDGHHVPSDGASGQALVKLGHLPPRGAASLSLKALVGPDARQGLVTCYVRATGTVGTTAVSSPEVSVPVYVQERVAAALGSIEGVVFVDADGDGERGPTERPVNGAALALDYAEVATTDSDGRFFAGQLEPGEYVLTVASEGAPRGLVPRSPLVFVSVASGQTARVHVPLVPAARDAGGGGAPGAYLAGGGVLKLEASPGQTSWDARGGLAGTIEGGPELTFGASLERDSPASGRAALVADIGESARLVAGISNGARAGQPALAPDVRIEAAVAPNLGLAAGYDGGGRALWTSAEHERLLARALTLRVGARLERHLPSSSDGAQPSNGDPASVGLYLAPRVSLAYSGTSGISGSLSYSGGRPGSAEAACLLPLGPGLGLSLVHRWTAASPPCTVAALSYGGAPGLSLGIEYELPSSRPEGTLRLSAAVSTGPGAGRRADPGAGPGAGHSAGDRFDAGVQASLEPGRKSVSVKLFARFPGLRDMAVRLAHELETRAAPDGAGFQLASATLLSASLRLDERTVASASWSAKRAGQASADSCFYAVTRGVSIHLERELAPYASLGLGALAARQDPGSVSFAALDLSAAFDIGAWARVVAGYRSLVATTGSPSAGPPWSAGPYVRLVLALGGSLSSTAHVSVSSAALPHLP